MGALWIDFLRPVGRPHQATYVCSMRLLLRLQTSLCFGPSREAFGLYLAVINLRAQRRERPWRSVLDEVHLRTVLCCAGMRLLDDPNIDVNDFLFHPNTSFSHLPPPALRVVPRIHRRRCAKLRPSLVHARERILLLRLRVLALGLGVASLVPAVPDVEQGDDHEDKEHDEDNNGADNNAVRLAFSHIKVVGTIVACVAAGQSSEVGGWHFGREMGLVDR